MNRDFLLHTAKQVVCVCLNFTEAISLHNGIKPAIFLALTVQTKTFNNLVHYELFQVRTSQDVRDSDQRGLLWLLDEEAIFPGATDDSFTERVLMHHGHGSDRRKFLFTENQKFHPFVASENRCRNFMAICWQFTVVQLKLFESLVYSFDH